MPEDGGEPRKPQNGTGVEPTEADPCMDRADSKKPPKDTFVNRYVAAVGSRTGLNRRGVFVASAVVALAVVLLVVVVALAAAWPRIPHKFQFPVCGDAACLRASAQISECLNTSVSPCEDLWTYVCGGWLIKYPLPQDKSVWNPRQQLLKREAENVRDLVNTLPLPLSSNSVEGKMKRLYDACMDVDHIEVDGSSHLLDIISELGSCYVLGGFNMFDYDRDGVLKDLHCRYGVSPFFEITVEPNPHTPGVNSVRISPAGLGLPDREYYYTDDDDRVQRAYKEFITDTIMHLGATRSDATKFSNDMFSYEKRIAEVTPDRATLQNPITTYNPLTLQELKLESNTIKFYDILQALFPDANISESTEVVITSTDYLSRISSILSSTDTKTLNGYFTWTLIRSYVPYLSNQYTEVLHTFKAELFGIEKPPKRWEICSDLLRKYMGVATDILLEKRNPMQEKVINVINNTFKSVLNVVKNRIQKIQGSSLLQTHLKQKLANLNLQVGIPQYAKNETYLKDYYLKLAIINSNLFVSVKKSKLFRRRAEEKKLLDTNKEIFPIDLALTKKIVYVPSQHTVVIPRNLLSEDAFESGYPKPVIYGRLGVEIAQAVISAVLPYESLWTANRNILSPFHMTVNESLKTVASAKRCLSNYITNHNLNGPIATASETALNILKHLSAINVANEALMSTVDEKNHIHQPAFEEYDDSPLFFLTYAQTQCSEGTSQQHFYDNLVNFELSKKSLLYIAWAQLPEFSKSFDCRQNKKVQCHDLL